MSPLAEDDQGGDISLSTLPSSSSMPSLSALLPTPSRSSSPSPAPWPSTAVSNSQERESVVTPTPKLYGRGLFAAPTADFAPPSDSAGSSRAGTPSAGASASLGSRPAYARKWENDHMERSNSATAVLPSPSAHSSTPRAPTSPTTPTPTPTAGPSTFNRRTPSNGSLGRSRSLTHRSSSHGLPPDEPTTNGTLGLPASSSAGSNSLRTPSMRIGFSRRPGDPRPPPLVADGVRERAERWVKEIVVCNFDLERGPVVERRALGRRWGPGEKENVAFSSFPDTSLFTEGSILFSFKIRSIPPDPSSLDKPEPPSPLPDKTVFGPSTVKVDESTPTRRTSLRPRSPLAELSSAPPRPPTSAPPLAGSGPPVVGARGGGDKAEEYRRWDERGREWLFGYVWFEQRKDRGIARGYMQKSLVILSHLPFPSLYFAILEKIAPIFFEHGYSALEAACHSIASWPDPMADSLLELPFMSDVLSVKIPDQRETPQISHPFGSPALDSSIERPILASLPNSTPLRAFASFLPALWSIWECLVLAEPVLVIAPDPRRCSEIVWWFRDLLRPIPPAGDFRPYLHIHDHDFSLLVNSNKPQAGVVVGVTNPFFRNAASHWPNVVSVPADRPKRVVPSGASSPRLDSPEGFLSRRHRSVLKDRSLLKRLEGLVAEGRLDEGNDALRTHFQQLTEKMLVPLNRYFQTLIPPAPNPGAGASTSSSLKPFSIPAFLTHLRTHQPNPLQFRTRGLSTKSRVENDFYAAFCMSPTFAGWLHARIQSLAAASNTPGYESYVAPAKPSVGRLGLGIREGEFRNSKESHRLSSSTSTGDTGYASSDATRPSSDSGSSSRQWRQSEEVSRTGAAGGERGAVDIFGRRGSDGVLKALSNLSVSHGASGASGGGGAR